MRGRRRHPDDLAEELKAHLAHEEADLRASGLSAAEAARAARLRFGSTVAAHERVYDSRWRRGLETLWQDLRYGARLLRRSPAFALSAALVLSLGIGANTALFSVTSSVFAKPLPVPAPEELFYLFERNRGGQTIGALDPIGTEYYLREGQGLATFTRHWVLTSARLSVEGQTQRMAAEVVESNYFDVLGVGFALGRGFRPEEDDVANPELSIVISHDLWTRRFESTPDVLGRRVRLNDRYFRVIGVAAPGFEGLSDPWHPVQAWVTAAQAMDNRIGLGPVGRLKPGVTFEHVEAWMTARAPLVREERWQHFGGRFRAGNPHWRQEGTYLARRASDVQVPWNPDARLIPAAVVAAMAAVVALVLVIATANIAGLLLARGVTRRGEIAVRRALGAGGFRLVRQLLTETVLVAAVGGVFGGLVAAALVRLFAAFTPAAFAVGVVMDWRVLAFAVVVSIGTGLLVGLAPALQAARVDVLPVPGSGHVKGRRASGGISRWILIPQVALALVLLLVAAAHVRALAKIELQDPGYRTDRAVVLTVGRWEPDPGRAADLTLDEYRRQQEEEAGKVRQFNRSVLDRVREVPGIEAFGLTVRLPLNAPSGDELPIVTPEQYHAGASARSHASRVAVSDGYFDAMGMRLLRGRTFDSQDALHGTRVAVVSEALANDLWPAGAALGRSLAIVPGNRNQQLEWLQVVGVVNEVDPVMTPVGGRPLIYVSLLQEWRGDAAYLVVRGQGDRASVIRDVQAAVVGADTFAEVTGAQTLAEMTTELLYPRRLAAAILAVAGGIGLALSAIGLYGVVAYAAAQRLRELGVRAALGAHRWALVSLLLREGVRVIAIGIALGLVLGFSALRVTSILLPDLPTIDTVSVLVAPLILAAVVLIACLLPARRAARMNPASVLRGE